MAPDRGHPEQTQHRSDNDGGVNEPLRPSMQQDYGRSSDHIPRNDVDDSVPEYAAQPQHFTVRGVLVGLAIGIVICFSNMYFGLQTGWISGMAMPSALIGFAYFKVIARHLKLPFSPEENVLVQSVAGSVGTMPLGCGFVGVIPALNFMLKPEEGGPLDISLLKLIVFAVGICFFGVVFAVPLRRQFIIRERLKFPSGTATALMIGVLHGKVTESGLVRRSSKSYARKDGDEEQESLIASNFSVEDSGHGDLPIEPQDPEQSVRSDDQMVEDRDWKSNIKLLVRAFAISAFYVCILMSADSNSDDLIRPLIANSDSFLILHPTTTTLANLWTSPFP